LPRTGPHAKGSAADFDRRPLGDLIRVGRPRTRAQDQKQVAVKKVNVSKHIQVGGGS
jgi:hypothetical protein